MFSFYVGVGIYELGIIFFVWKIEDFFIEIGSFKFEDIIVVYVGYVDYICNRL